MTRLKINRRAYGAHFLGSGGMLSGAVAILCLSSSLLTAEVEEPEITEKMVQAMTHTLWKVQTPKTPQQASTHVQLYVNTVEVGGAQYHEDDGWDEAGSSFNDHLGYQARRDSPDSAWRRRSRCARRCRGRYDKVVDVLKAVEVQKDQYDVAHFHGHSPLLVPFR